MVTKFGNICGVIRYIQQQKNHLNKLVQVTLSPFLNFRSLSKNICGL